MNGPLSRKILQQCAGNAVRLNLVSDPAGSRHHVKCSLSEGLSFILTAARSDLTFNILDTLQHITLLNITYSTAAATVV